MDNRAALIDEIVEREWQMFQQVENQGGRATCQNNQSTFRAMRASQFTVWSEGSLESYLQDLQVAENEGRNLLTEKYARMMEFTGPKEFAAMSRLLPRITPEANALVEAIVAVIIAWEIELQQKYPHILSRGRPLHSSQDTPYATSLETYLRCELKTYSIFTLKAYCANVENCRSEKRNGAAVTMLAMMRDYGYSSLEEANEKLAITQS